MSEGSSSSEDELINKNLTKKELLEIERRKKRNKQKKLSKKRSNKKDASKDSGIDSQTEERARAKNTEDKENLDDLSVDIEYVGETPVLDENDPNFAYFKEIFETFKITPDVKDEPQEEKSEGSDAPVVKKEEDHSKAAISEKILQEEMQAKQREEGDEEKMSKKKLRLLMQPSIASLKESTQRPDVVEWADVTSRDPHLLVALKAYRNTVPVPRHWNAKRKYLAGKRGFERPPFQLPEFIKRTGIQEMRESLWEKEEAQNLKSKMRERARPKLGKIDIDYQKLHDAFFKWQTKPVMTTMGELYFEGKEQETQMKELKPGNLSDELRIALGMPVGPNSNKFPPPWLIAMQRYGPPPSYPTLKIPGLSAPIPEGCAFGYHAGGWGKPPVDEYGKPLYGDVFGVESNSQPDPEDETLIERRFWGEIGSDESSEEESEEEEEEDEREGLTTPITEGFATPSGMTTGAPTGLETPDTIELRKGRRADESTTGADTPAAAYHILPEKKVDRVGQAMMGSTHVYDLSKKQAVNDQGVEISLDPESIDLDQGKLEEKYEEQLRKQSKLNENDEDFSDMVAEHTAKMNRKRKAQEQKKTDKTGNKKYKDFKF